MKIYLITLLLAFLCLSYTQAQTVKNPYTAKIDSIHQLLTKRPTADTLRVVQLNDLAQVCFKDLQYKRGLQATKEARALAKKLNFEHGEGLYFLTMRELNDASFLWFYYNYKAIWSYVDRHEALPMVNLNLAASQNTDAEKSNKALFEALAYFEKSPDAEITANILELISYNYRTLKKVDESVAYLDKAFEQFQEAQQPMAAYFLLAFKSTFLERNGKTKEAKSVEQAVNKFIAANPDNRETALIYMGVSNFYYAKKDVPLAFAAKSKANLLLERLGEQQLRILVLERLGNTFNYSLRLPNKSLEYYLKEKNLAEVAIDKSRLAWVYHKVVFALIQLKRFDEATQYVDKAKKVIDNSPESDLRKKDLAQHYDALGQILMEKQKYQEALPNFNQAIKIDSSFGVNGVGFYFNMYVAQCYQKMGNLKESIRYGLRSYDKSSKTGTGDGAFVTSGVSQLLFENYDSLQKPLEAYKYLKIHHKLQKQEEEQNIANRLAEMEVQSLILKGEQEKNRLEQARLLKEKENQNQRWWLFSIAAALLTAIVLAVILYRNNQHKQKANALLHRQKEEIDLQRNKAEKALTELKATQNQLIQKEKLASLGELTAGIAHEIQNPLNFVNNFSELSVELAKELKVERLKFKDERDEELESELVDDLIQNQEKINHHGKRASSIVKGMLEHSRTGTGESQLTDINQLADEYLRLAYHGMRAKDKDFNADYELIADENLSKINVVPQEIGRVVLNLLNNAFYAVNTPSVTNPKVVVSTSHTDKQVIIKVQDNGSGIPDAIKAKIFQPFFTTKPTGEGTGLGLSLAYDIVTKGHGGTIEVESVEGEGTTFIIKLPIHN